MSRSESPRPQARRTQTERSEETRIKLVSAAARLLHRKGYAGLRTAEVSAQAGVSRGGQLHHFPTKDSLVIATAEHILARSAEIGRRRAAQASATDDILEAIIADSVDFFFSDEFATMLDLVVNGGKNRRIRDAVFASARTYRLEVEEAWRERLVQQGMTPEAADKVLWIVVSVVRGLAVRAQWQKDDALFRSVLDTLKSMIRGHFR